MTDELPDKIKVSGFPFLLQGWNNIYYKKNNNGNISYRLDPYILYYIFPIIGTTIYKENDKWVLYKDFEGIICEKISDTTKYVCNSLPISDLVPEEDEQKTPFGNWSFGVIVEPYEN